jgi:hypothetical protein
LFNYSVGEHALARVISARHGTLPPPGALT